MALHLTLPPSERMRLALHRTLKHTRSLCKHIRAAHAESKAQRIERERERQKAAERMRIGFEALAVSIRSTTGNFGKPKPR